MVTINIPRGFKLQARQHALDSANRNISLLQLAIRSGSMYPTICAREVHGITRMQLKWSKKDRERIQERTPIFNIRFRHWMDSIGQERSEPKRKMPKEAFLVCVKKTDYAINGSELPVRQGRCNDTAIDTRLPQSSVLLAIVIVVVIIITSILFEPIIIAIHLRSRLIV
jgi:hypothetical protein